MEQATKLINPEDIEIIQRAALFSELPRDEATKLLTGATIRRVPRNTLLFSQGDVGDRFFVLLEGKVKLFTAMENGDQGVVEIVNPVRTFAEAASFASARFPLSAEIIETARLVQINTDQFLKRLAEDVNLAFRLLGVMSRWHRRLVRQISELKLKSPGQRLGSFILSLTEATEGPAVVRLPFDKTLIASHVGMKPESLSRAMARLREIGVICERREVTIHDIGALQRFCGEGEAD